jgi:hypothetical protein
MFKLTLTIPVAFGDRFSLVRLVPGTSMEMNFLVWCMFQEKKDQGTNTTRRLGP